RLPEDQRQAKLAALLQDGVNIPFDSINGPFVRVQIIILDENSHILVITAHHIVCDGWSIDVIMRDIGAFYSALENSTHPAVKPAESIIDYARVERQWRESDDFKTAENYWLEKFRDAPATLDFPTDRPHPPLKTVNGARIDGKINADIVSALKSTCAQQRCSFVNLMFAAFNLYVYRCTGQSDLVIGLTSAGQSAREMETVVGHCVNLLPIRTHIDDSTPFSDYLKSVRTAMLDALDHQHYTYGTLVKNLKIKRDPARVLLIPVVFNYDTGIDLSSMNFNGLSTEFVSNPRNHEHFEIFLNISETNDGMNMEWSYNTDLFDADTIRRHMSQFQTLLAEIAENSGLKSSDYPVIRVEKATPVALEQRNDGVSSHQDQSISPKILPSHLLALESEMQEIWCRIMSLDTVDLDANFFELGGHSLLALRLFNRIHQQYEIDLPISTLFLHPTIRELATKIAECMYERTTPVLTAPGIETTVPKSDVSGHAEPLDDAWDTTITIHPGGAGKSIFIVGGIGGNVNNLHELGRLLGKHRPMIGIQTRGILGHKPYGTLEEVASDHIRYIRARQSDGPYLIAGYSGGGLTAFEIARQLKQDGDTVAFLGIIDSPSPQFNPEIKIELMERLKSELLWLRNEDIGKIWFRINAIIRNSKLNVEYTKLLAKISPYKYRLKLLEYESLRIADEYKGHPYDGSLTLFKSTPHSLYDKKIASKDPDYGWQKFVSGKVEEIQVSGDHLDMVTGQHATKLADAIERSIEGL
ncbi:MAG: hypothetical protein K9G33_12870, partial [Sneathiella sp.]|nr:hypothetical protein [Sneathiella sp.]